MNKNYWVGRASQRELESQIIANKYLAQMEVRLREVQQDIIQEINSFYARYAKDNKITNAEARKLLTAKEMKDFKDIDLKRFRELALSKNPMYEQILNEASYRVRISRLEALNWSIEMKMLELYGGTNGLQQYAYTGLSEVYQNSYYKTMYDLSRAGIVTGSVSMISDTTMREVLSYNWSGKEFSNRIWGHQSRALETVKEQLEKSFISGRSIQRTTKAITDRVDVSRSQAENLVRTESNFFHGLAAQNSYVDADIEEYEILATLDSRTSKICRKQDGKVYKTKDYEPGVTANPFHSRCRTTTIPRFDESEYMQDEQRQSADGLVEDMSYEEWYDKYVTSDPKRIAEEKMIQNKSSDKNQHEKYREVLGEYAPRSFAEFQNMKYTDNEGWSSLKSTYRDVNWMKNAQTNYTKVDKGSIPKESVPNSVSDRYGKNGELTTRRYYGRTGKARLDIDFQQGNPKYHEVVPHVHDWTYYERQKDDFDVKRSKKWRELNLAEKIANKDVIK